jgi:hypothetical protein
MNFEARYQYISVDTAEGFFLSSTKRVFSSGLAFKGLPAKSDELVFNLHAVILLGVLAVCTK